MEGSVLLNCADILALGLLQAIDKLDKKVSQEAPTF